VTNNYKWTQVIGVNVTELKGLPADEFDRMKARADMLPKVVALCECWNRAFAKLRSTNFAVYDKAEFDDLRQDKALDEARKLLEDGS